MLVVGLTGGVGSGKTTVANMFGELGVPIVDADESARRVTERASPALAAIAKHFGDNILKADGNLDRAQLRRLVFADAKQRLWLESLLHPLIEEDMRQHIAGFKAPYCIAVIPLLLEVEFYSFINRILVVDASESEQVRRVQIRDNVDQQAVEAILKTQARREDRLAKAHDVIINEGDLAELMLQVKALHEKYLALRKIS